MAPEQQKQPPDVWVSPDNPFLQQLDINKPMALVSPLGRLGVEVQLLPGLHPEAVVYRRGDWISCGGGINQLIADRLTDMGSGGELSRRSNSWSSEPPDQKPSSNSSA